MSSTAKKLCEEICDHESAQSFVHDPKYRRQISRSSASGSDRYKGKPTSSIRIEKKREINKVIPKTSKYTNKIVINKFKSRETLLEKNLVDAALNTVITGPIKCDTDSMTIVRTRDSKCVCGHNRKKVQSYAKEIQTLDFKRSQTLDKASARLINTINCGVQENNISRAIKTSSNVKLVYDIDVQTSSTKGANRKTLDKSASTPFKANSTFMGARRWALSKGPSKGPDF